jgi:hypothetical protein
VVEDTELTRPRLVWETRFMMAVFLAPAIAGAVVPLARHIGGVNDIERFPRLVPGNPLANMVLGIAVYATSAAVVPLALFLLMRTGQPPAALGLVRPSWRNDIWPGVGVAGLAFLGEFGVLIVLAPLLAHSRAVVQPLVSGVPDYYVLYGLAMAAVAAVTEEVIMNGYLMVRMEQLGWTPRSALVLALVLRSSYHIYYGLAVLAVVPVNYFLTRSFQKHKRLERPIIAHFLYDAVLITVSVLTA